MREIALTQGMVALVDDEDYEELNRHKWYAKKTSDAGSFYAARFQRINGRPTTIYMHREIMNCNNGMEVDHRDGNTLDNRKEKLRTCTKKQNLENRFCHRKSKK